MIKKTVAAILMTLLLTTSAVAMPPAHGGPRPCGPGPSSYHFRPAPQPQHYYYEPYHYHHHHCDSDPILFGCSMFLLGSVIGHHDCRHY